MNTQLARGMREAWVWGLAAVYAGTQIVQSLSDPLSSSAFNATITLSSFGAAIVQDVDGAGLALSRC